MTHLADIFINPVNWKISTKYPVLPLLAKRMFCITATTESVKGVFSRAGLL